MGAVKELLIEIQDVFESATGREPTYEEADAIWVICASEGYSPIYAVELFLKQKPEGEEI